MPKKIIHENSNALTIKAVRGVFRWKKAFGKKYYIIRHEKVINYIYFKEYDDLSNMINTTKKVISEIK